MVLKPNFVLKLSARVISATHPSHHIAASYKAAGPRGDFRVGHLSQRKVYMPSMNKVVTQCAAALVVCTLALPVLAQEPSAQGGVIKSQVSLVNAFFSREVALPITLAMLLDTSGSEQDMLASIQDAGSQFIARIIRKGDEALVMSFDANVDLLSDFTDERSQLERAIHKTRINVPDQGARVGNPGPIGSRQITGTALYDAIYLACGEKLATEAGRKAIVIVTDAQDEGSKVKLEEAVEAAQRTDTVIHILLVADPRYGGNPGVAHKLAEETGGRMISVRSEKKLMEAFDEISQELRSQYTLGYYPTNSTQDGKFRRVKVETAEKDLKVLTRKGYYAPKG
ncbi:MAG: VWA domain-containing protein [Acidobacteria bacterium]|nr:MAG: VWA domain-containing protein [Acidobacteriota bacterium]